MSHHILFVVRYFFIHITAKNTADYENYGTYWNNLTEIS